MGVPAGVYSRYKSTFNKAYAIKAVDLLRKDGRLADDFDALWEKAFSAARAGKTLIAHNSQMDVVVALWNAGLIVPV